MEEFSMNRESDKSYGGLVTSETWELSIYKRYNRQLIK